MSRFSRPTAPIAIPKRSYGLHVGCQFCGTKLSDFRVDTSHWTPGEKQDYLIKFAQRHGWKHNRLGDAPGAPQWMACPTCQAKKDQAENGLLPTFDARCKCPKCGNNRIGTRFCTGLVASCTLGAARDHLHRTCQRCNYDFVQACKDESIQTEGKNEQRNEQDPLFAGDGIAVGDQPAIGE